jgi:acyl-CoA thioesterase II
MGNTDTDVDEGWTAAELVRLMSPEPVGPGGYRTPAHGPAGRVVVDAGQLLGAAVVAAALELPDQRPTSVSMIFSRVARHDEPIDIDVEVLRRGRTLSTVQVRTSQGGGLTSAGLALLDRGADELIRATAAMPPVDRPEAVPVFDRAGMRVAGREMRLVDDAYDKDGPAELFVWTRFTDAPDTAALHTALMTYSIAHWTIAAALRPHAGYSEGMAHTSITTGISTVTVAYHDPVDVTEWLLSATTTVYSGLGHTQSEGRVYTEDGRLVASAAVQGMIRPLTTTTTPADRLL